MTVPVELTPMESKALAELSGRTGKSSSTLVHEAVVEFLKTARPTNDINLLQRARGMWRERNDLPDFARLRREWDRS